MYRTAYARDFVGLQRQTPFGVRFAKLHGVGHDTAVGRFVAHVAGLQKAVGGSQVWIGGWRGAVAHHFELVAAREHRRGVELESIFRGERDPVHVVGQGVRAVGLHRHEFAGRVEAFDERRREEERGLTARDHHVTGRPLCHGLGDLVFAHELPRFVQRVAKAAVQVAAAQPNEDRRRAGPEPFALQRVENFVDLHKALWAFGVRDRHSRSRVSHRRPRCLRSLGTTPCRHWAPARKSSAPCFRRWC